MKTDEMVQFWLDGAKDAWETMKMILKGGKYHFALFFCQLTLEKQVKALVVKKTGKVPPPLHDLIKLAAKGGVEVSDQQRKELDEINSFNLKGRYDDYKLRFQKKATKEYADKWVKKAKEYVIWFAAKM